MKFSRIFKAILVVGGLSVAMLQPAAAQSGYSDIQQQIILGVIQNITQSVRDQIQGRRLVRPDQRIGFSGEEGEFNNRDPFAARGVDNPFGALAYAKSPYVKAPVAAAPVSAWLYGANLIGSGDRADSIYTRVNISTVTGAFDVTKIGIFTATDALTFIGTGTHSWSRAENTPVFPGPGGFTTDSTIPAASGTLSYLNGGFSADFTALASWTRSTTSTGVIIPDSSSISYTGNAQYRFDFPYTVWFEPTAGVTYTEVYTANFGTKILDTTEVHGGGRVGFETKWLGFTVQPQLSGAVFKIVDANAVAPLGVTPPDALGGRASGKITVLWTPNFSSYAEVHGSGIAATKPNPVPGFFNPGLQTYGAQGGLRYTW